MVLEVPNSMIGDGEVAAWSTASLFGHAPEVQICRWGLPLFTHLYLSDTATANLLDKFHERGPADDVELFGAAITRFTSRLASKAGAPVNPKEDGAQLAARLLPVMLPYELASG